MRNPTNKIIIDPARRNAGSVIPNIVRIRIPKRKNVNNKAKIEQAINMATARCTCGDSFSTCPKKIGMFPIGFKIAMMAMKELTKRLQSTVINKNSFKKLKTKVYIKYIIFAY